MTSQFVITKINIATTMAISTKCCRCDNQRQTSRGYCIPCDREYNREYRIKMPPHQRVKFLAKQRERYYAGKKAK